MRALAQLQRGFRRAIGGILRWVVGAIALGVGLVVLALAFVLVHPNSIRDPLNQILSNVVAGKIEITRLTEIRWDGIAGADGRVVDESGKGLAHAYDVSARISWWNLIRELLSNDSSLDITIQELEVGHIHLDISPDAQGEPAFVQALIPPPSAPSGTSRPVTISFESIVLRDGWVHGQVVDQFLDAKIHALELSLAVTDELVIENVQLLADIREPSQYKNSVDLRGEARLIFHETDSPSPDSSFLAALSSKSRIDLRLGDSQLQIDAEQTREEFQLVTKVFFAPSEARTLGFTLNAPLSLQLEAGGDLADIEAKLEASFEQAQLKMNAHARHENDWSVTGSLSVDDFNPATFGVDQISPLSIRLNFFGTRKAGTEVAELERYFAKIQGKISSFQAQGKQIPPLALDAELQSGDLNVKVESGKGQGQTRLAVSTSIGPSGQLDQLRVAGQIQAQHAVPYVKPLQNVEGVVQFSGDVGLSDETLDVHVNAQLRDVLVQGGVRAASLNVDADADGNWSDPRLRATASARDLRINEQHLSDLRVRIDGSLARAFVAVRGQGRGLSGQVQGNVGIKSEQIQVNGVSGSVTKEANQLGFALGSLKVRNSRIQFEKLALSGIALGELSGSLSGESGELNGSLRDVSLIRVGQMLDVALPLSGQVDVDVAVKYAGSKINGRVRVEGSELVLDEQLVETSQAPVPALTPLRLSFDLLGEGGTVTSFLHLREMAQVRRQAFEVDLKARAALPVRARWGDPLVWWEHLLRVSLTAEAPLKEALRAVLPPGWQTEGHLAARFRLKRESVGSAPSFSSRVATTGLKIIFPRPRANGTTDAVTRETLENFDVQLRLRHDPERQISRASIRLADQGKPWVRVRGEVKGSLERLMAIRTLSDLTDLHFDVNGNVPARDVMSWPKLLQVEGLRGVWGGEFSAKGTLARPQADVRLSFSDWHSTAKDSDFRLSGGLTATYDSEKFDWKTELSGARQESLRSTGNLEAPWNAKELRPAIKKLNMTAELKQIPLHALSALEHQNIRGPIDLQVKVSDWGTNQRQANAKVELGDVYVRGISLQGAHVHLNADNSRVEGEVHLRNEKFFMEGKGQADLVPSDSWLPVLGDSVGGELEAKDVPLQVLRPLLSAQLAGLAGTMSAQVKASQRAEQRSVEAAVQIRDGRVQVPSVGQRLHDIDLDLIWDRQGVIRLEKATFRGTSGKGSLEAEAVMKGIEPQSAKLRLIVKRDERLPISLFGAGTGEFWGDIRNEIKFDWEQQKITVDTKVKEFQMQFPELPTGQLQSLEADEHIRVGTQGDQGDWIEVALQPIAKSSEDAPWNVAVAVDLGKKFWLQQGPTRRIQLGGGLSVDSSANEEVRVEGQLKLARGRIELNGRMFEVREGTITFQPEEPDNPVIVAAARWESPEGTTVIASFSGPVKSGEMTLTSDPPLPEDQVLSLLLFGDTAGLGNVGTGQEETDGASQAAAVGGSVASQGLNQALSRIEGVDISTRVGGGESGNVRPEVVVQLTNALSAEVGYNLQEPSPGKSPDRTLLALELRLVGGHSLSATVGDRGTSLLDWVWRYRY